MAQTVWLPHTLGLGLGHWAIAPLAMIMGMITAWPWGAAWLAGGLSGHSILIVTLGGLLIWSRVAYFVVGGFTRLPPGSHVQHAGRYERHHRCRGKLDHRSGGVPCGGVGKSGRHAGPRPATASPSAGLGDVVLSVMRLCAHSGHCRADQRLPDPRRPAGARFRRTARGYARRLQRGVRSADLALAAAACHARDDAGGHRAPGLAATSMPPAATLMRRRSRASIPAGSRSKIFALMGSSPRSAPPWRRRA